MANIENRAGGYRVAWRYGGKREGARQSCSFPGSADGALAVARAAKRLAESRAHLITGDEVYAAVSASASPSDRPLLEDWFHRFLDAKTGITPGVRGRYRTQFTNRIAPELGRLPLDLITPSRVGAFVATLRAAGLSDSTIARYYSLLHGALDGAVAKGHIRENPCDRADFVRDRNAAAPRVYLSPADYRLLCSSFAEDDRILIELLAGTGARWSESTALRVGDLIAPTPASGPALRILRAWKDDENGRRYLGPAGGRQRRVIGISAHLWTLLRPLTAGRDAESLLVSGPDGREIDYDHFYPRRWVPAVTRAMRCRRHPPADEAEPVEGASGRCRDYGGRRSNGKPCGATVVPGTSRCRDHAGPGLHAVSACGCPGVLAQRPTPHDLRHTHAAWLFADPAVTPLVVSRRLGHASLRTTAEVYGGWMPGAEAAAVSAIAAATGGTGARVADAPGAAPVVVPLRREPSPGAFAAGGAEAAYWCGWIVVAGRRDPSRITVEFAERDRDHLARLQVFLGLVAPDHPAAGHAEVRGVGRLLRMTIASPRIAADLERLSDGRLAGDRHFWRGVVDGAGWTGVANGVFRLQLISSLALVEGLIGFLRRSGVALLARPRPVKRQYRVQLSGRTAAAAAGVLYRDCPVSLERRAAVAREWLRHAA